jgi:2-oxoisovalerate dehydrogenase E2 component (dihydrolipoyl transacylase)
MVLAAVMTDKATVEIPSPVTGTVVWLGRKVGDTIAVKAPLGADGRQVERRRGC